jgi:Uma2 family endonuclease
MSRPETVEVYKLTVRDFHALSPFLGPDRRHELLDGQIFVMPPPGRPHTTVWRRLQRQFLRQERPGWYLWEGGLRLDEHNEPWPDLALVDRDPDQGADNPGAAEAKLVIEVSHTTLYRDIHDKLQAYQRAGVPEYWVVDVEARRVLRHLAPDYQPQTFSGSSTPLSPQAYPDVTIDVGALFEA